VRLHLRPTFEKVSLSKLSPQHVRGFLNERLASGLSARRVQYLHAVLRAALNTAVKDQLLIRNVAAVIKPPLAIGKEVQPLTPEEARRFLEALGLRWSGVDFEAGTLRIRYALQRLKARNDDIVSAGESKAPTKRGKRSVFHLVAPKTKQSRRTIAMPKLTLSALAEHKARQVQEKLLAGSAWHLRL